MKKITNKNGKQFGYRYISVITGEHIAFIFKSKLKYKYVQTYLENDVYFYKIDYDR